MSFSQEETKPGENVTVTVLASPHSSVGVLVIDQSVRSVGTSNEITQAKVSYIDFIPEYNIS